ncbi:MAG: 50S ribosomal protein L6, partial [Alphaproteobacteria bacterium]|nr:50S ribosomal protein L6 [Alphaproteobacteria bacterium]
VSGQTVTVKGPKGQLSATLVDAIEAKIEGSEILVAIRDDGADKARAMWGMSRTIVNNLVVGVTDGYRTDLEINGVGFRAAVQGKNLQLQLGYSHEILYPIPQGIEIKCEKPTSIAVSGIDKQRVGQVAAEIRAFRPPEPYKGKGVKYANEFIFRKEGKKK